MAPKCSRLVVDDDKGTAALDELIMDAVLNVPEVPDQLLHRVAKLAASPPLARAMRDIHAVLSSLMIIEVHARSGVLAIDICSISTTDMSDDIQNLLNGSACSCADVPDGDAADEACEFIFPILYADFVCHG